MVFRHNRGIKKYNISRIVHVMIIILLAMVMLNFGVTFYAMQKLSASERASITNILRTDINNVEKSLQNIHSTMQTEIVYDTNMDKLTVAADYRGEIDVITTSRQLKNIIINWSKDIPYTAGYAIYFPLNDIRINDAGTAAEYDLWRRIETELIAELDGGNVAGGWCVREYADEYFITDIIYSNGRYIICYIRLEEVIDSFANTVYGDDYYVIATGRTSDIYYGEEYAQTDAVNLFTDKEEYTEIGYLNKYLVIGDTLWDFMDLHLIINDFNGVLKIFSGQLLLGLLLLCTIGCTIWFLYFVTKSIVRPIELFNANIEKLKIDDQYTVDTYYQINELGNASELMADMVSKIKGLKINIYEKTLEQQKTKMDFLTLQIEPHFYLNCLNIIYNMAQMGEYVQIQRLSGCVSDYLRYIFKSREQLVTVEEELGHINKYLEIQKIRYPKEFETHINVEEEVSAVKLPPIIIQTFVENAIKHTITWEDDIELFIKGEKQILDEREMAVIRIEDTGEGFDQDILYKLQNRIDISEGELRIGIMNAISRLHLVFEDEADIHFSNRKSGGAVVELRIPFAIRPEA